MLLFLLAACEPLAEPPAEQIGLEVEPAELLIPAGRSDRVVAWGLFDDGTRVDQSELVGWISSSEQFAVVSEDDPGFVDALQPGASAVTATLDAFVAAALVTVGEPAIEALIVSPLQAELPVGASQQFLALALRSDGSAEDITGSVVWTSSVESVAAFDPSTQGLLFANSPGLSTISGAAGDLWGGASVEVGERTMDSVRVLPEALDIPLGLGGAVSALGTWSDGQQDDVTGQATWRSTNEAVATVSNGVITTVSTGLTTLEAELLGEEGSALLTVTGPVADGLEVRPDSLNLVLGEGGALESFALFTDGSEQDVTRESTWSSDRPEIASGSNDLGREGAVDSLDTGTAEVSATWQGFSDSAEVDVLPPELVSLALDPASVTLALGESASFTLFGTYTDGRVEELSGAWASSDLGVALVTPAGLITPMGEGAAVITATAGSLSVDGDLEVLPAQLLSIALTPSGSQLPAGAEQVFVATGAYSDGVLTDLSEQVFWGSSAPGLASVTNLQGLEGTVTAHSEGSLTILASYASISGSVTLEVVPAALLSLAVEPAALTLASEEQQALVATATWTDGSETDVTALTLWSSDDPSVVTASNDASVEGVITAVAEGDATVTGSFGSAEVEVEVTVELD